MPLLLLCNITFLSINDKKYLTFIKYRDILYTSAENANPKNLNRNIYGGIYYENNYYRKQRGTEPQNQEVQQDRNCSGEDHRYCRNHGKHFCSFSHGNGNSG